MMEEKKTPVKKKATLITGGCILLIIIVAVAFAIFHEKNPEELNTIGNTNVNIANGGHMAKDGEWIYYTEDNGESEGGYRKEYLVKSRLDGSEKQYLTDGNDVKIESIFVTEDEIYFTKWGTTLCIKDKRGSEKEPDRDVSGVGKILGIVEDTVYYLASNSTETTSPVIEGAWNSIGYLKPSVGKKDLIYQSDNMEIVSALISDGQIYFATNIADDNDEDVHGGGIFKVSLDGKELSTLYKADNGNLFPGVENPNIYIDANTIYFRLRADTNENNSTSNADLIYSMDKSGENLKQVYSLPPFLPWLSEYVIIDDTIYVSRLNFFSDEDYNNLKTDLFLAPLDGSGELHVVDGECSALQVIDNWLYYKDENYELKRVELDKSQYWEEESQIIDADELDNMREEPLEESEVSNDNDSDGAYTSESDLIGSWQALDEDDEPVALQFLSEERVLIKSGIIWQEETFDEYHYFLIGTDQIVFEDEEGTSKNVFFELDTNAYGSDSLRIDYGDGNEVLYDRVEKIE